MDEHFKETHDAPLKNQIDANPALRGNPPPVD